MTRIPLFKQTLDYFLEFVYYKYIDSIFNRLQIFLGGVLMAFENKPLGNDEVNLIIEEYMPLILKTISETTGRYVSIENDEEFSVGLLAFTEAVERYDEEKGIFSSFAKLVISSRVKNHIIKEKKNNINISFDELAEMGIEIEGKDESEEDNEILKEEIEKFKKELKDFNITLEDLAEKSPKHEDTRKNAIGISKKVSKDEPMTNFIFTKKRLPIKRISLKYLVTEKVIKRSKEFILSVVIILYRNYRNLRLWIRC